MIDASLSLDSFTTSPWSAPWKGVKWGSSSPVQIGGLANRDLISATPDEGDVITTSLEGCLSELRIAGEVCTHFFFEQLMFYF